MSNGVKLLLVGCGKMGGALLRGIAAARLASSIVVVEPAAPPPELQTMPDVAWVHAPASLASDYAPDAVIVAVKPQAIAEVLPAYSRLTTGVFLSIAAGTTLVKLAEALRNPAAAIVRAMPNLPASIGQGMTAAIANPHVSTEQRALCDAILKAVGESAWVENEGLLDTVTALSGSGPAYVFALCETMAKAGEALGLSRELAQQLARQTVIGSGALLAQTSDSVENLRKAVTSPKGTTEAGLARLLAENGLGPLIYDTMQAAAKRSKELAQLT